MLKRISTLVIKKLLFWSALFPFVNIGKAYAQQTSAAGLFTRGAQGDLALSWLNLLFHSKSAGAEITPALEQITQSIRHILGMYSTSMLVLASFLLLYYVLMFITQSAHTGHMAWGQKSKLWAPLRFALVISLLVPVSGGLNLGQVLIVKLTQQGSALASNAWANATENMNDAFAKLVTPRAPDLGHTTARALEMAMCRSIYRDLYAALQPDTALVQIGNISDLDKRQAERLNEEQWAYANKLHETPALCGAYRFSAPSSAMIPHITSLNGQIVELDSSFPLLGDSARAAAERLSLQSSLLADSVTSSFLSDKDGLPPEARATLSKIRDDQKTLLQARLKSLASEKIRAEKNILTSTQEKGWVSAGWILLELMNRQAVLGTLAQRAVPSIDPPILGHKVLSFDQLKKDIEEDETLRTHDAAHKIKLFMLYDKAGSAMKSARSWLYQNQMDDPELVLSSSLDLEDALPIGSTSEKGFTIFHRLFDSAFATFGVWGHTASDTENDSDLTLTNEMKTAPIAALGEMGRRYINLGQWVIGMASASIATPSVTLCAALYALLGGFIALAGFVLLFLIPMIPLFRFLIAVLTWLLLVFEAVVSVPLVAIAHMNPSGEGLISDSARRAYCLWLSVLIRPFLIVFGFLVGWAGFYLGLYFLNQSFAALTGQFEIIQIDTLTGLRLFFALLYAAMVLLITNVTFKGIAFFPERTMEWLGGIVQSSGQNTDSTATENGAGLQSKPELFINTSQPASSASAPTSSNGPHPSASGHAPRAKGMPTGAMPTTRDSQLFPQFHDKDIPPVVIAKGEGAHAVASSQSEAGNMAGAAANVSGDKAVAIATAKASVTIKESRQHGLSDMAREIEKNIERINQAQEQGKKPEIDSKKDEEKESPEDQMIIKEDKDEQST